MQQNKERNTSCSVVLAQGRRPLKRTRPHSVSILILRSLLESFKAKTARELISNCADTRSINPAFEFEIHQTSLLYTAGIDTHVSHIHVRTINAPMMPRRRFS